MANRLAGEASPYLVQHAQNPVDWYPWGAEALAAAKELDRPILLSIGYSACHWCHVMERESFEDETIAALMNLNFVNVKVDREERPDLDHIYQLVVQLMGKSGGWPLTVFLTPEQKPFFGGTYFPPVDRYGMPGFPKILNAVAEAYRARRDQVDLQANELAQAIAQVGAAHEAGDAALGPDVLERAARKLSARFDDTHGGFGSRPKFPNTMSLDVLLRHGVANKDATSLKRARKALDAMRAGGIYDHLGGGFHRYSTDERWLVPHFEKMLYDNALLLRLYVDAWRATRHERYAETAREIAAYVAREMTDASGGFYSTQDADSEGEEGRFFVWSPEQIREALGDDKAAAEAAIAAWGVTKEGNFEEAHMTVLHEARAPDDRAALERAKGALFAAREKRVKPFRDEKMLASWNGLMIGALADAGAALGDRAMTERAARAFAFVEDKLVKGGRVLRHALKDTVKGPGFLDDHAFVADAALDLFEATGEPRYVARARALADVILKRFADAAEGGFFFTPDDGEKLICRAKDPFDHAIPSGASIACKVLSRLGALVGGRYEELARKELERLAPAAIENPFGMSQSVVLLDRLVRGSVDVVLVGPRSSERTRALADAAMRAYLPNRNVAWLDASDPASREACAALAEGKPTEGEAAAFVCRGRTCSLPIHSAEALARELQN